MDVPLNRAYRAPALTSGLTVEPMATPGAASATPAPAFEKLALASFWSTAPTATTPGQLAGVAARLAAELPAAATITTPFARAYATADCVLAAHGAFAPRLRLTTRAPLSAAQ